MRFLILKQIEEPRHYRNNDDYEVKYVPAIFEIRVAPVEVEPMHYRFNECLHEENSGNDIRSSVYGSDLRLIMVHNGILIDNYDRLDQDENQYEDVE